MLEERSLLSGVSTLSGPSLVLNHSAATIVLDANYAVTQWTVNWGDGQTQTVAGQLTAPSQANLSHTYIGPGTYEVSAASSGIEGDQAATSPKSSQTTLSVEVDPAAAPTVTSATTDLGSSHRVDVTLAANEHGSATPSGWTVYWGDGSSSSYLGTATAASHTYQTPGRFPIVASMTDQLGTWWTSQLAIVGGGSIALVDPQTGRPEGTITPSSPLTLGGYAAVTANGTMYVTEWNEVAPVYRFDARTGAYLGTLDLSVAGITSPSGIAVGPDGNVYLSSVFNRAVYRFDGQTGAYLGVFVASVPNPYDIGFGPDGDLYVNGATNFGGRLERFDGRTGAFLGVAAISSSWLQGFAFAPDGTVYDCGYDSDQVDHFDPRTGALLGTISTPPGTHPTGLAFDTEGNLLIAGSGTGYVLRYSVRSDTFLDNFFLDLEDGFNSASAFAYVGGRPLMITVSAGTGTFNPVATESASAAIEGVPVTFGGTFADPNDPSPADHTYSWKLFDETGTVVAQSTQQSFQFTPTWSGTYTAEFTVTDSHGFLSSTTTRYTAWVSPPTLTISGIGVPTAGAPYTVNLSASGLNGRTLDAWTINWGDGTTDTLPGTATTASHDFARDAETYQIDATARTRDGTFVAYSDSPDLLIESSGTPTGVTRISAATGENQGGFLNGGPLSATGIGAGTLADTPGYGPDGSFYEVSYDNTSFLRYDGRTGVFLGAMSVVGMPSLAVRTVGRWQFGPDGYLYFDSWSYNGTTNILRYDVQTGASFGAVATIHVPGFAPVSAIGPDGTFYVESTTNN